MNHIPTSMRTLLIDKAKGEPIGFVKRLSVHFKSEIPEVTADWESHRDLKKKYEGIITSIKWSPRENMISDTDYLTLEVSDVKETTGD